MIILYDNKVLNSTINALTENLDYTFDVGLKDSRLSRVCRTLSVDDQTIVFDLGAAYDVNKIWIKGHNFTSSATLTLEGNSSDLWGAPAVSETLTYNADCIYKSFTTGQYRYWRIVIDDPTNTDGYLEIAKIFLGDYLQLPGINPGVEVPYKTNSSTQKSATGQNYGDRRLKYRAAKCALTGIERTERDSINAFWNYCDIVQPFVLIIWEDDLVTETPIYCNLIKELDWIKENNQGNTWALSFEFEETF